jgi:glycosyltransferase involved in cell wall biosynthesis
MTKEMGLRGRNFVEVDFTIEKIIEKLEKLYEEAIKSNMYEKHSVTR